MKALFAVLPFIAASTCFASEPTISLRAKVRDADAIALCELKSVQVRPLPSSVSARFGPFANVRFVFERREMLKGAIEPFIVVEQGTWMYGGRMATAGFSHYGLESGDRFLIYLEQPTNRVWRLVGDTNQYLEQISADGKLVTDLGQTMDTVPLAPKLAAIRGQVLIENPRTWLCLVCGLTLVLAMSWILFRAVRSKSGS